MNDKEELKRILSEAWYNHDSPAWYEMAQAVLDAGYRRVPELTLISPEEFGEYCRSIPEEYCKTGICQICSRKAQLAHDQKTLKGEATSSNKE